MCHGTLIIEIESQRKLQMELLMDLALEKWIQIIQTGLAQSNEQIY